LFSISMKAVAGLKVFLKITAKTIRPEKISA
jgi:hypothetical protein